MPNLKAYTIPIDSLDLERIIKTWTWLTGENKTVIAMTKLGDLLLKDQDNKLLFLDTGRGTLKIVDGNYLNFMNEELDNNLYEEILLTIFIDKLEYNKMILKLNQVYTFYKLPSIGGRYIVENIYPLDVYEHCNLTGELHLQLRDLHDGTKGEPK